jgi:hypothetical protein
MGTHLYICDNGGPMTLAVDGTAPQWVTCPVGVKSLECTSCPGAQLQGEAAPFAAEATLLYRCSAGHERRLMLPAGLGQPESAHCPDCGGMLLLVQAPPSGPSV